MKAMNYMLKKFVLAVDSFSERKPFYYMILGAIAFGALSMIVEI